MRVASGTIDAVPSTTSSTLSSSGAATGRVYSARVPRDGGGELTGAIGWGDACRDVQEVNAPDPAEEVAPAQPAQGLATQEVDEREERVGRAP
ncbi:hypothetical protein GCM10022239_06050 [Leifsonia bigeumensis]|uniref:Uncharacterized protein n=1 Tax=Leifsonella bigeumensis TaxID=433643 RepID=A0ABP7F9Q6_9MICO